MNNTNLYFSFYNFSFFIYSGVQSYNNKLTKTNFLTRKLFWRYEFTDDLQDIKGVDEDKGRTMLSQEKSELRR